MATSTIPTLKSNLITQLAARASLAGVQLTYGVPQSPEREFIWVGDVEFHQDYAAIGHSRKEEDYTVTVLISVLKEGTDQTQAATERAFALMAEIEAQLRSDPTVNGAVRLCQVLGPGRLTELQSKDGNTRGAHLLCSLHAEQRI